MDRIFYPYFNLISDPNLKKDKILILGPRYENEIFLAKSLGFKKIYALDNFSYSPLIDTGDMHNLKYPKNFFDAIVCGWTLSYSKNPALACSEMKRVLKKNGSVIISVEKVNSKKLEILSSKKISGVLIGSNRLQTKTQFDNLFNDLECICVFEDKNKKASSHFLITYKKNI